MSSAPSLRAGRLAAFVRRPAVAVVLAVQLALVLLAALRAVSPATAYAFTPDTLENWAIQAPMTVDADGYAGVAELGAAPEETLFSTPQMTLPPGYYTVRLTYRAQAWLDEENDLRRPSCALYTEQSGTLLPFEGTLDQNAAQQTLTVRVQRLCTDARVLLRHNGAAFAVGQVEVCQNRFLDGVLAIGLALALLAADALALRLVPGSPFAWDAPARGAGAAVLAIGLAACVPLLHTGGGMGWHDTLFHLERIEGIARALGEGQFPVRLYTYAKSGYGYAPSLYYGELLLYLPALLRLLGLDLQAAYKLYLAGVSFGTAAVCYACLRPMFSRRLAVLGTALYTLNLYRLICVYLRAAVGEYTAMLFLPVAALGLWRLYAGRRPDPRAWPLLALAFGGLLQTHIITFVLCVLCAGGVALAAWRRTFTPAGLLTWGKAGGVCVLANLWFLLPFLSVAGASLGGTEPPSSLAGKALSLAQLLTRGETVGFGLALPAGAAVLVCAWLVMGGPKKGGDPLAAGSLAVGLLCLWASTDLFPWDGVARLPVLGRVLGSIQFPWRFLGLAGLCLTLAALCGVRALAERPWAAGGAAALCAGLTLLTVWGFLPDYIPQDSSYLGEPCQFIGMENSNLNWKMDDLYLPDGAQLTADGYAANAPAGMTVNAITREKGALTVDCTVEAQGEGFVDLPLLYYPGYRVVDGPGVLYAADTGLVGLAVPAGFSGTVTVAYREPLRWLVADAVSALTLAVLAVGALRRRRAASAPT